GPRRAGQRSVWGRIRPPPPPPPPPAPWVSPRASTGRVHALGLVAWRAPRCSPPARGVLFLARSARAAPYDERRAPSGVAPRRHHDTRRVRHASRRRLLSPAERPPHGHALPHALPRRAAGGRRPRAPFVRADPDRCGHGVRCQR